MSNDRNAFRYLCSHDLRAENPLHRRLTEMFDAIRRETDGRLEVDVIPWGGTGPSKVTLTKLLDGEIAFHPVSGMPLSTIVPIAAMEGLPFAFDSEQEACRIMDGEFGDLLRNEIAAKGLVVFPRNWPQGNNQITSSTRPIRTVEELTASNCAPRRCRRQDRSLQVARLRAAADLLSGGVRQPEEWRRIGSGDTLSVCRDGPFRRSAEGP